MHKRNSQPSTEAGFSLIELMIAMTVTLVVMSLASSMLAGSFNIRSREDSRSEAIADVQRALNIMTREIASGGYRVPSGLPSNGIVEADSNTQSIRILSNFNAIPNNNDVTGENEDVTFRMVADASGRSYIARHDPNFATAANRTTVLANRIDALTIRYYDEKVTYDANNNPGICDITNVRNGAGTAEAEVTQKINAQYIVVAVCIQLPQVRTPGGPGYQPAARQRLVSDVRLRNVDLLNY